MNVFSVLWLQVCSQSYVKDSNRQSYNHNDSVKQKRPHGLKIWQTQHTLLWSNNLFCWLFFHLFNLADCYFISHNHRKLDFVFYFFEKHCFQFYDNVTTIAGTVTGLLWNNDVKDCRSASVTDVLFLSSGLTTEQGTLSCVASSSKCNWVSFNCDGTRLEANESHSCLEVILAKMIRRHVFEQNHHTLYFLSFCLDH